MKRHRETRLFSHQPCLPPRRARRNPIARTTAAFAYPLEEKRSLHVAHELRHSRHALPAICFARHTYTALRARHTYSAATGHVSSRGTCTTTNTSAPHV